MTDLVYVGTPTRWLPKFVRVTDCGPSLDGSTGLPSGYYRNVGVSIDGEDYVAVVANYQVVPVAEFDLWRETQALSLLAEAASEIQDKLEVDFRVQALTVVLRPREGSNGQA